MKTFDRKLYFKIMFSTHLAEGKKSEAYLERRYYGFIVGNVEPIILLLNENAIAITSFKTDEGLVYMQKVKFNEKCCWRCYQSDKYRTSIYTDLLQSALLKEKYEDYSKKVDRDVIIVNAEPIMLRSN